MYETFIHNYHIMTRKLSKKEIESLVDFITPQGGIPADSALVVCEARKDRFRVQLSTIKIYPELLPKLKQELLLAHHKSLVEAGESVGVLCAQSIGEKQTQTCLNTFHKAGLSEKTMTTGAPRIQELLNASKEPKNVNCKIFFNDKLDSIQDIRDTIGSSLVCLSLKKVSESITVCMDKADEPWYEIFHLLYPKEIQVSHDHCVRIQLNMDKLFEYQLTVEDIAEKLENEFGDLVCVWSPPELGILDVFVDTDNIELPDERVLYVDAENAIQIYMEECVCVSLSQLMIAGIQGIGHIFFTKEDDEWFVETESGRMYNGEKKGKTGHMFSDVLSHPAVDMSRTLSNDVWDIYTVLGVEAARQFLIEEYMNLMEGINLCHPTLLVERMTFTGTISSISRYTMRKDETGPMGAASFEETLDNFTKAAAQGKTEPTIGVSASIICGKKAAIGTGMCSIKMDLDLLESMDG
jgi:DNA-directed RNA polymerase II subunit RPB1